MVLLRGLLGAKASFVPTVLNIAQCLGWAVFELLVISAGLQALTGGHLPRWVCVLAAGGVTTALTIWPLGSIRVLRKYVSVLVVIALVVLAVGVLRNPMPQIEGSWSGFWLAVDAAVALTISWVPLGADYSRHSRSPRAAFPVASSATASPRSPACCWVWSRLPGAAGPGPGVRPVPGGAAGHGRLRGAGAPGDRSEFRQRLFDRGLDPEHGDRAGTGGSSPW